MLMCAFLVRSSRRQSKGTDSQPPHVNAEASCSGVFNVDSNETARKAVHISSSVSHRNRLTTFLGPTSRPTLFYFYFLCGFLDEESHVGGELSAEKFSEAAR